MPGITVDQERCKGCEICTSTCPQKILGMSKDINVKGYFYAKMLDPGRCIGCMICAICCPDLAISVRGNAVQYRVFDYFPFAAPGK